MVLSWNEIKSRSQAFAHEWSGTQHEHADAKPFLVAFFDVFGISTRRVSSFEYRVRKLDETDGYIDLLWKGVILIEMKSKGRNLDQAFVQANNYLHGLKEHELPKLILLCDFDTFKLHDLETQSTIEFKLNQLPDFVREFGFLLGFQKVTYKEQDPANIKAAELMGKLHDRMADIGYTGHKLEVYLIRLLFCLFAEDTSIFNKRQFQDYIEQRTNADGSDLASKIHELFEVLNTPPDKRLKNLDEQLAEFPYVNGKLFEEKLDLASFDSKMRQALLDSCYLDWSKISPAIFGSMFQSVMDQQERRDLGAHYTSEQNILKVIKPLFLDDLYRSFEQVKSNTHKLKAFHDRLSKLTFLDPACGCGNFLVVAYRELRLLEIEVLKALYPLKQGFIDINNVVKLNVDQFFGIEYEEFPARIAEVAMWLIDHQLNMKISEVFGQYFIRLPLEKAVNITHGDALEINWQSLLNPLNTYTIYAQHANIFREAQAPFGTVNIVAQSYSEKPLSELEAEVTPSVKFDYIMGNPPFIGSKMMNEKQHKQVVAQWGSTKQSGILDYVSAWYIKAAKYINGTKTKVAFVSTNSITQGEQVGVIWGTLLEQYGIKIHFAHQTFKWTNEAKGKAAVYCVIIGFAQYDTNSKVIYHYEDIKGEPIAKPARNINPYLVDAYDIVVKKRTIPFFEIPHISFGNQPIDGGNLLLSEEEKLYFVEKEPITAKFIRRYVGSDELINKINRYCLWLVGANPAELRQSKLVFERLNKVKVFRERSTRPETRELAKLPSQFAFVSHPETDYIIIPSVSSERRRYIPIDFMPSDVIASNLCLIVPNASLYHFGVLTSAMHMAWVAAVCGRLKSDYRYSANVVYNNFPWPEVLTEKQKMNIEKAANMVLEVRKKYPDNSLSDLYHPLTMPADLQKAHNSLDLAVDLAYRPQAFANDSDRLSYLFGLYAKYTADMFTVEGKKSKRR